MFTILYGNVIRPLDGESEVQGSVLILGRGNHYVVLGQDPPFDAPRLDERVHLVGDEVEDLGFIVFAPPCLERDHFLGRLARFSYLDVVGQLDGRLLQQLVHVRDQLEHHATAHVVLRALGVELP